MIQINQESLHEAFQNHLEIENNNRILFSGPFGTGKSTMLEKFFTEKNETYFVCKLTPVNYSIASNEDVFELIKYDLLSYLLANFYEDINLEKEDFSLLLRSQMFIMEKVKFMPLLYAILGMSEKIGKPAIKLLEAIEKVVGDFKTFSKEIKIDEEEDINKFIHSIRNTTGNIYEMDSISRLINSLLERLKTNRGEAKSVLIIDDLDRLDPDHIFRLFNIFSSQEINESGANKFGFDKVVFVCDVENIRKIFHHKYGQEVDFLGYIDKFYSLHPFEFDNRALIKQSISEFISKIKFSENLKSYDFKVNERFESAVKALFISLLDARVLNYRMLHQDIDLTVPMHHYARSNNLNKTSHSLPLIVMFYLLKNIYATFEILYQKILFLSAIYDRETFSTDTHPQYYLIGEGVNENFISYCLDFIIKDPSPRDSYNKDFTEYCDLYNCYIHFEIIRGKDSKLKNFIKATISEDLNSEIVILNPYQLLLDSFEICRKKRYLK